VNWHCEAHCNYGCGFCYAPFETQRTLSRLTEAEGVSLIHQLVDAGVEKINFVGGEPMLHPHLDAWIKSAKFAGLVTSIVSNGTRMTPEWLTQIAPYLDWLGLSIDASTDEMHAAMGRGTVGDLRQGKSRHLEASLAVLSGAKELGFGIKLNTVVTSINVLDDMSDIVALIQPTRWKIFQVLRIEGENDGMPEHWEISTEEFEAYVEHHRAKLSETLEIQIVAENNDAMLGTYAMVDAQGRAYTNENGRYLYSSEGIHKIGFTMAWGQVSSGFSPARFVARDGEWQWSRSAESPHHIRLPVLPSEGGGR